MKSVFEFLKKLFAQKDNEITVLLYDDSTLEDASSSYRIRPDKLIYLLYGGGIAIALLVLALIAFTPLKSLVIPGAGTDVRQQVIQVSHRVNALEDSIEMRERQLREMKKVLLNDRDTTFTVNQTGVPSSQKKGVETPHVQIDLFYTPLTPEEMIQQVDLVNSNRINRAPDFPVPYPVEGTFTRGLDRKKQHFGIDIATASGASVFAIADGTVIGSSWTPNYGYVLRIQHAQGYVSVYKHCLSLLPEEGDVVEKGDLVGEVADVGILSSGPHLHFELWKRGIPLDPKQFLIEN